MIGTHSFFFCDFGWLNDLHRISRISLEVGGAVGHMIVASTRSAIALITGGQTALPN